MAMKRIVCVGECMVEFFQADPGCWKRGFAGDTLNVAWAMRALLPSDWQVAYASRVGCDTTSDDMLSFIAAAGIDHQGVIRDSERSVGLYTIKTDAQGERSFDYWRSNSAARRLADDSVELLNSLNNPEWVYLSGITTAIIGASGRAKLLQVLAELRSRGVKVVYDPNYRPRLWESVDAMRDFAPQITALADLVMPTFDDEVAAFGDQTPEASVSRLLLWGARQVILKNGTEPALTGDAEGISYWPLETKTTPIDTTGAGDSFNGGFLAAYIQGQSLQQSIHIAQSVSAQVVTERGALVPYERLRAVADKA